MQTDSGALHAHRLQACHQCGTVQPAANQTCSFCRLTLHGRKKHSLQRSWIYLLTSMLLYLPANFLPIMTTRHLGAQTYNTIAGGVVTLWEQESYLVAIVILIASLMVPVAKFIALFVLCLSEQLRIYDKPHNKVFIFRVTEFVGRWSMVDVFVVAFLASLIQLGDLLSIYPGPAALAFAGMVIFSMLAANSLDPKVFWDDYERSERH